jgi:hypothetical protein
MLFNPLSLLSFSACRDPESNWGHADFQSAALPTELSRHECRDYSLSIPGVKRILKL